MYEGLLGKYWKSAHLNQLNIVIKKCIMKIHQSILHCYLHTFSTLQSIWKMLLCSHFVGCCSYTEIHKFHRSSDFQIVYLWGVRWRLGSTKSYREQYVDCMEDVVKFWFHDILSPRQTCEQVHYHETSGYPGYQSADWYCCNVLRLLGERLCHKIVQWH